MMMMHVIVYKNNWQVKQKIDHYRGIYTACACSLGYNIILVIKHNSKLVRATPIAICT